MSKAYDLSAIADLPFSVDLVIHAFEKEKDLAAWDMWVSMYPYMQLKMIDQINFTEFKTSLMQKSCRYSKVTDEEVMDEMLAVVAQYEGR